ncbi:MAG: hydrogenase nickel incorporation protein HypB [Lachnospiraceae bacterium]|nr:hydrogenase nickel incorporation protein HypB [Lachnospiraceae bacterium]
MSGFKVLNLNVDVNAANDRIADEIRSEMKAQNTFLINIMASPGAGKTTTLLSLIPKLRKRFKIGVMEADIEAEVDAVTMENNGVKTIQVHTGGECAMDADMTLETIKNFDTKDLDLIFMENIGNLVCPAENDIGANLNVAILSVPEGDDKPLKYPLMFKVTQACIINKIDTKDYFPFDEEALVERVHKLNPSSKVFFISAKTGEGVDELVEWISERVMGERNA